VNFEKESSNKEDKKNICSSRQHFLYTRYESQLKMVKAFILDTAFKNDYQVAVCIK
jgi:hypothetical protein